MLLVLVVAGLLILVAPSGTAWAHAGEPPALHDLWALWNWDVPLLIGFAAVLWVYGRGVRAAWRRAGDGRGVKRWQVAAFGAGMAALAAALFSPVDAAGEALFSAHMIQHLLLMLVAAPLLVLGAPPVVFAWAIRPGSRVRLARWWAAPGRWQRSLKALGGLLTRPWFVWVLHAVVVLAWHLPGFYQAALVNETLHAMEHASFLGTALLFWWVVVRAGLPGGIGYGSAAFYVFTAAMYAGVFGALITFSRQLWYPLYAGTTAAWGLTPLEDQQLAGAIMWVPGNLVYVVTILLLLWKWFEAMERNEYKSLQS